MSAEASQIWKSSSLAVALLAMSCAIAAQKHGTAARNTSMKTVVNNLAAEISVTPLVKKTEDLRITVTLTNESQSTMRLNAMYLNAPTLRLRFVDAKGAAVATGPPPTPRPDDGKSGRVELAPGKSITVTFEGPAIFSSPLPAGRYWVLFHYRNDGSTGDWAGLLDTPRVGFDITGS